MQLKRNEWDQEGGRSTGDAAEAARQSKEARRAAFFAAMDTGGDEM